MPTAEHMTAAVHAYVDGYARGDADGLAALFAPDAQLEDPVGAPKIIGQSAIRDFFAVGVACGARLTLHGPIRVGGDYAAFAFHVDLTWEGAVTRIEPIDIFRFNDAGQIVSMQALFGPADMASANKDQSDA